MIQDSASGRVVVHLTALIDEAAPGDRLPSVRSLMSELGVSPSTVRAAVSELVRAGRIETISGSGTYVAPPTSADPIAGDRSWQEVALAPQQLDVDFPGPLSTPPPQDTIDLASGYPDLSLQPNELLKRALNEAARRPGSFGRAPSEGIQGLRSWFCAQLDPNLHHETLITSGGQAALSLIFRTLALPGDTILMESPTYIGAIAAARSANLTPTAVPMDSDGIIIDQLAAAVSATGARLLYLQPRFHNPTGTTLTRERRTALMDLAHQANLIIIEDDWLFDLDDPRTAQPPLAANDPHGHVVHLRSLTKSAAPGMRIAAIASTGAISYRLKTARAIEDFFVSPILQEAALNMVTSPSWNRHLKKLRAALATRRQTLVEAIAAIDDWDPTMSGGPLHVWLTTPQHRSADALRDAALRQGLIIVSGSQWYPSDPPANQIRISSASAPTPQILTGIERLARAIQSS